MQQTQLNRSALPARTHGPVRHSKLSTTKSQQRGLEGWSPLMAGIRWPAWWSHAFICWPRHCVRHFQLRHSCMNCTKTSTCIFEWLHTPSRTYSRFHQEFPANEECFTPPARTHSHALIRTHTLQDTHTHAHTHTRTHAHTHTCTHSVHAHTLTTSPAEFLNVTLTGGAPAFFASHLTVGRLPDNAAG
jgi:hypothetical protein